MKWIKVSDRLPEVTKHYAVIECSDEVQIFSKTHGVNQAWLKRYLNTTVDALFPERVKGYWLFESQNMNYSDVTHWMPLPEPPKD